MRVVFRAGAPPLGLVFGAITSLVGAGVALLHLDRLPYVLCVFKALTGLPCPTCGSTRTLGRLFSLDLVGALGMNPLATVGALALLGWAALDLALLPRRRSLRVELDGALAAKARVAFVGAFLVNWVYLLASGR